VTPASRQLALARRIARQGLSARRAEVLAAAARRARGPGARRKKAPSPYLEDVVRRLEERLGTKVTVGGSPARGTITIHYFNEADRERILLLLT